MFLRVSSLRCASHVESNLAPCLPLPRPSTRCGVVERRGCGGCGGWWRLVEAAPMHLHQPPQPPPTSLTCFSSHFAVREGLAVMAGEEKHPRAPLCEQPGGAFGVA